MLEYLPPASYWLKRVQEAGLNFEKVEEWEELFGQIHQAAGNLFTYQKQGEYEKYEQARQWQIAVLSDPTIKQAHLDWLQTIEPLVQIKDPVGNWHRTCQQHGLPCD